MAGLLKGRAISFAVALAAVIALGATWAWLVAPAAGAAPVTRTVNESPASVEAYWTKARMREAIPAEQIAPGPLGRAPAPSVGAVPAEAAKRRSLHEEVPNTRKFPNRTHGKVFFTIPPPAVDQGDYVCSGTAVRAPSRSMVWSAGHCGFDAGQFPAFCDCFMTHWMFVPGFKNGARPFGKWPASSLATTSQWMNSDGNDSRFDFSAATVVHKKHGKSLEGMVGARRIAFGQPRNEIYRAYGYPAHQPPPEFDGRHLFRCVSGYRGADHSMGSPAPLRISCDMNGGSSGGGWVIKRGKRRYVASVTSYFYTDDHTHLYGPYQGNAAHSLYEKAKNG